MSLDRYIKNTIKQNNLEPLSNNAHYDKIEVSILVLCYNHAHYLERFFESVLSQKVNFGVEIIINDDCSTDCSRQIIEKYSSRYPNIIFPIFQPINCYFTNRKHIMDSLIKKARGKYYSFCESDDYFYDVYKLLIQRQLMNRYINVSACFHFVAKVNSLNGEKIGIIPNKKIETGVYDGEYAYKLFSLYKHPQTSSFFIRKEALYLLMDNYNKLSDIVSFDDMSIFLLSSYKRNIIFINRVMSCYSYNIPNSWMTSFSNKSMNEKLMQYEKLLRYYKCLDVITNFSYTKYFDRISTDRELSILLYKGDFSTIFHSKKLRNQLKHRNLTSYYLLRTRYFHPKMYNCIRNLFKK